MIKTKKKKYAYIFDFDGVLVNSMQAHFECYQQALEEVGVPIVKEKFFSQAGMTGREQIQYFVDKAGVMIDSENVYRRKRQIWQCQRPAIEKIDCNLQLLRLMKDAGCPVAVASGSSRQSVLSLMQEYKIEVNTLVGAEDVQKGKPFPDLFLRAAERLDAAPENCIVIEDSDVGIQAAQAAGMKVMRFYDNRSN